MSKEALTVVTGTAADVARRGGKYAKDDMAGPAIASDRDVTGAHAATGFCSSVVKTRRNDVALARAQAGRPRSTPLEVKVIRSIFLRF